MTLNDQHVSQFQREGYTSVPHFFDTREVKALQREVERFKREGLVRNVATDGDGQTPCTDRANLQLIPLHDKSDLIRALPFVASVRQAIAQLIGTPAILHLDQMFLKPGRHGTGTDWHQDNAYFKIADPLKGTAMWVAIHDATITNGTIHVVPGSHSEEYEHSRDPNSDHHIHCQVPEERAVPIELAAGGVAFFCYGTAHCTKANLTDDERAGMAFHFLHHEYMPQANTADEKPLISGPDATGGLREYGVQVDGMWDVEVARTLATS